MPINMSAITRYRALDKCLRNFKKKYFIEDLKKAVEEALYEVNPDWGSVSMRTIRLDLAFMRKESGYGAEIETISDGGKSVYYRYSDPNFSINNVRVNDNDANGLREIAAYLEGFIGQSQFAWLHEALPRIFEGINVDDRKPVMEFESNPFLPGLAHLNGLYNAIINKVCIKVIYQDFRSSEPYEIILHPHFLKQYNGRWFLFGLNDGNKFPTWNLAIDRIKSFKELNSKKLKYIETEIDWSDYFEDIIGVTRPFGKEPERIELEFWGDTCKYIESKPLHGSQRSNWIDENRLKVTLDLIINYELERLILSYSGNVKVVAPEVLRVEVERRKGGIKDNIK